MKATWIIKQENVYIYFKMYLFRRNQEALPRGMFCCGRKWFEA